MSARNAELASNSARRWTAGVVAGTGPPTTFETEPPVIADQRPSARRMWTDARRTIVLTKTRIVIRSIPLCLLQDSSEGNLQPLGDFAMDVVVIVVRNH